MSGTAVAGIFQTFSPSPTKLRASKPLAIILPALLMAVVAGGLWFVWAPPPPPVAPDIAGTAIPDSHAGPVSVLPHRTAENPRKVELGRRLFSEKRLSRDDSVACDSCHDLAAGGVDGRPVSTGIRGQRGDINAPTVYNSAFNFRQFWDGRAATLEEQAGGPVHNPLEMDSNWEQVLGKLRPDDYYRQAFKDLYGGMSGPAIQDAIAVFERTLVTPDSPFDRHMGGDPTALSVQAAEGWRLFRQLGCVTCHQGVNFGGNMYAGLGVMGDYFRDRGKPLSKGDLGRFNITGRDEDRHVFKVPSLRNVAQTGPYFHDGSVGSLDEAVILMARYQLGVAIDTASRERVVAFLHSLTGTFPEIPPVTRRP